MNIFNFFTDESIFNNNNKKIVLIPRGIKKKDELFNLLSLKLNFPFYFGKNWDALYDCLLDLSWIIENEIVIIHEDIPLDSENEKTQYIELLFDLLKNYKQSKPHNLKVMFPQIYKKEFIRLLNIE